MGINWSTLKQMDSPAVAKHNLGRKKESTRAMVLGSLTDCLITQPNMFDFQFSVRPDTFDSYRTDAAKEWLSCQEELGLIPVTPRDVDLAKGMVDAVFKHPEAGEIFTSPGEGQCAVEWTDSWKPVMCRGLLDWVRWDDGFVELKTTTASNWDEFAKRAFNFKYHGQMAFYNRGLEAVGRACLQNTRMVVVMQDPPHLVQCYQPSFRFMDIGWGLVERMIEAWSKWRSVEGEWIEYPDKTPILDFPDWVYESNRRDI